MEKSLFQITLKNMDLQKELINELRNQSPFDDMVEIVKKFKAMGNSKEDAISELEQLRTKVDSEIMEDTVLELMDLVSGFCYPGMEIW